MNNSNVLTWLRISLLNLLIVAVFGALMRYKIAFSFPWLEQKNLQHAHSHFAFLGWVTHTLYVLILSVLHQDLPGLKDRFYRGIINTNLVCSYGMLVSFSVSGYSVVSITLSTLSIFLGYAFAFRLFADIRQVPDHKPYKPWFVAAMWLNIISSIGTFTLAYMMGTHNFNQKLHLASLYFYLHFQYNGFFLFTCFGLLLNQCVRIGGPGFKISPSVFWMLFLSCIPAYFLSVLWMKMPMWLYVLVVLSAIAQFVAWIMLFARVKKAMEGASFSFATRALFFVIGVALTIKFGLQLGSTVPVVSKLAFGFRPIVIAYLHLVLLAIISVYLLVYVHTFRLIRSGKLTWTALISFIAGVYLTEAVLGVQGIASFSYTAVPHVDKVLFVIAALMVLSLIILLISQFRKTTVTDTVVSSG